MEYQVGRSIPTKIFLYHPTIPVSVLSLPYLSVYTRYTNYPDGCGIPVTLWVDIVSPYGKMKYREFVFLFENGISTSDDQSIPMMPSEERL